MNEAQIQGVGLMVGLGFKFEEGFTAGLGFKWGIWMGSGFSQGT